jgi:hypothetical protein
MSDNFENIPQLVKNQQDAVKTTVETFPKAAQRISAETADYSKQYFKNWTDFAEKLRGVTTFDEAIKLQTESPTRNSKANEINQIVRRSKATIPGAIEPQLPGIRQK